VAHRVCATIWPKSAAGRTGHDRSRMTQLGSDACNAAIETITSSVQVFSHFRPHCLSRTGNEGGGTPCSPHLVLRSQSLQEGNQVRLLRIIEPDTETLIVEVHDIEQRRG
jgi:hypothetical protein